MRRSKKAKKIFALLHLILSLAFFSLGCYFLSLTGITKGDLPYACSMLSTMCLFLGGGYFVQWMDRMNFFKLD